MTVEEAVFKYNKMVREWQRFKNVGPLQKNLERLFIELTIELIKCEYEMYQLLKLHPEYVFLPGIAPPIGRDKLMDEQILTIDSFPIIERAKT